MKRKINVLFYVVIFGLVATEVRAQQNSMVKPRPIANASEWKPHVGFLVGAAQPESSGKTASEVAIDVGFQPYIPFGLGAEVSHSRIDNGNSTQERNTIWAKGNYSFGGATPVLKNSYVGVALGVVFKPDGTSLAVAPLLGFDIPMKEMAQGMFSLGANMKYAIVADNELDTLILSGVVKYWY